MLEAIRNFIHDLTGASEQRSFAEDDYRLAAVALFIHVANADGASDILEQQKLKSIIAERFGLNAWESAELIRKGEEGDREAVDFYQFTSILKRALDEEGRLKIVELMWDMALADGQIHEFEENTIWRVAELLGIGTRDRILSRQRAEKRAGFPVNPADPE
jgi:uncharacterized tellurite resistance protein B-like protein